MAGLKRRREVEQRIPCSSSSALLPIPGMVKKVKPLSAVETLTAASRWAESLMASTSGRRAAAAESALSDAVVSKLQEQQNAEDDALVRMECERLRAGLGEAWKRQCLAMVRAASAAAAQRLRDKEVELVAARRRAAELEERLRQTAAESQAWCGLARSNEAVAAGLRATLDHLLRTSPAATPALAEGFGDCDPAADDAQSCCFEANKDAPKEEDNAGSPAGRWACKRCGEREASVLLLPCRHLCLCKECEPRLEACPVCLAAKTASVVALSPMEAF